MKQLEEKIEQLPNGLVKYWEGKKSQLAIFEDTLTKNELRIFCYFLISGKNICISTQKREKFKKILVEGDIPEEFGYITKSSKVFCVQKSGEEYKLYMGLDNAAEFYEDLRKFLKNVKK